MEALKEIIAKSCTESRIGYLVIVEVLLTHAFRYFLTPPFLSLGYQEVQIRRHSNLCIWDQGTLILLPPKIL